jgi:hypothetical protein
MFEGIFEPMHILVVFGLPMLAIAFLVVCKFIRWLWR